MVYCHQGKYDLALADYTRAIELNSEFALAYGNRGFVYYDTGDYQGALVDFNKAIELDSSLAVYVSPYMRDIQSKTR